MIIEQISSSPASCDCRCCFAKGISWSAVVLAALTGVGLSFLLNIFATSIGLVVFKTNPVGATVFTVSGFIGLVIGTVAVMFTMGWVSGRLGKEYNKTNQRMGVLYGFSSWCLSLILLFILTTHITHYVTSYYQTLYAAHSLDDSQAASVNVTEFKNKNQTLAMLPHAVSDENDNAYSSDVNNENEDVDNNDDDLNNNLGSANQLNKSDEKNKSSNMGMIIFVAFVLFFIAAIASCFGGYYGFKSNEPMGNVE